MFVVTNKFVTGTTVDVVMYPLDTLKTRLQVGQ